jgi:predicted HTH domain antitoxin
MEEQMVTLHIEFSDDLAQLFDSTEQASEKARESLVLQLLREERISQGKAAELLGVSRAEMLDLAAKNEISFGGRTREELEEEVAAVEAVLAREDRARYQ